MPWFMAIAELLTIISLFAILLPAAAMAREKEKGTVEQLRVSPLSPFQIMFPKALSMAVVILVGMAISLFGILEPIFHVPIKGSLLLFFAITTLYTFTLDGIGLFVATIARNLAQVGMLMVIVFCTHDFSLRFLDAARGHAGLDTFFHGLVTTALFYGCLSGILLKGSDWDVLTRFVLEFSFTR
jgi:ABC-2 type transport system permease protein